MNQAECDYWDAVASTNLKEDRCGITYDNLPKRRAILGRLLKFDLHKQNILEIGIGYGTLYAALNCIYCNSFKYGAMDVSKVFVAFCKTMWKLNAKQADVTAIPFPDASFDYVFAFDTLEHVRPDEREIGYKEIDRVLKKDAVIVLNIPIDKETSRHDKHFDHGFDWKDFSRLVDVCKAGVASYDVFTITYPNPEPWKLQYIWAVAERHL